MTTELKALCNSLSGIGANGLIIATTQRVAVNHWGSHPDEENDDCHTGEDFHTIADAIRFYMTDPKDSSVAWIEIDLSDDILKQYNIKRCRKNPLHIAATMLPSVEDKSFDREWQQEIANEAGMLGGVHAYNDAMGYDSEEYEP